MTKEKIEWKSLPMPNLQGPVHTLFSKRNALFCYFAGMTYSQHAQTFQGCERTVLSFDTGSFASYSKYHLTKLK